MSENDKPKAGRPPIQKERRKIKPNITLDPSLIASAKRLAQAANEGFSAWVTKAIENEIKRSTRHAAATTSRSLAPTPDKTDNIIAFPEVPLLHAAAGSPITADGETFCPTRQLGPGRFACQLHGDSMHPTYPDGSIVILRERNSLKRPVLKTGEIYLFDLGGEKTLKIYRSRKATAQEIEAGFSYRSAKDGTPKVRILKAINPTFPEFVVTGDIDWVGWLDKEDNP